VKEYSPDADQDQQRSFQNTDDEEENDSIDCVDIRKTVNSEDE